MTQSRVAALVVLHDGADDVRRRFEDLGFKAGPLVGISFSIEAPRGVMETYFPDFAEREGTGAELRLDRLPADQARSVRAVVSERAPAFGPGSY